MLNKDINSRFEDWLISPTETLDFEAKQWLNMEDVEAQGLVAKALIALENHGGGFLLFGYKEAENKQLIPDPDRPVSLKPYLTDAINAILKKRAEPVFHVEVTLQSHPLTGEEYPLVRVPGRSKVPVRSDSATAGGTLKQHVYYIRAPGPESRGPLDAAEWDALLRRAVLKQREDIVGVLRAFLPMGHGVELAPLPTEQQQLTKFIASAKERWSSLNSSLGTEHPSRIELGHYSFAARIIGTSKNVTAKDIIEANERARRYTGWPVFVNLHQDVSRPRLVDDVIEAWLAQINYPDVGHADFWRIGRDGSFFLLRGYQEDSLDSFKGVGKPGKLFEATLPVWRSGEFLLRVIELGAVMFEEGFEVIVECEWTGLTGRQLFVHNNRRYISGGYSAAHHTVRTNGRFSQAVIQALLPDAVSALTQQLYEHFDFFQPPSTFYAEELAEMTKNRF